MTYKVTIKDSKVYEITIRLAKSAEDAIDKAEAWYFKGGNTDKNKAGRVVDSSAEEVIESEHSVKDKNEHM
jgi:hypothetical protein